MDHSARPPPPHLSSHSRGAGRGIPSGRGGSSSRGRGGFRVGPAHAPRDAYLGKAKKIKADLIDRAKIKRSFAKTLKAEGLSSDRLRSGPPEKVGKDGKSEETGIPKDDNGRLVRDRGWGEKGSAGSGRGKGKERDEVDEELERMRKETGKSSGVDDSISAIRKRKRHDPLTTTTTTTKDTSTQLEQSSSTPASTSTSITAPTTSLRTLKRDAYALHHSSNPHQQTLSSGVHPSRTRVSASKAKSAQETTVARGTLTAIRGGAVGGGRGRGTSGIGAGGRGQPKMAARMDVLLEKIKRNKGT